jgi:Gram-negative bacterial TonB protein C-terminal
MPVFIPSAVWAESAAVVDSPSAAQRPVPESGSIANGAYSNPYFGLTWHLPSGWAKDLDGPPPSQLGYYVLQALDAPKEDNVSVLIAAQDLFFAAKPLADAAEMTEDFKRSIASRPKMVIDQGPVPVTIGGETFQRVDYSAGGLYRTWLATDRRCHVVIFNLTASDRKAVDRAVEALGQLSLTRQITGGSAAADTDSVPVCIKDYITPETTVSKTDVPEIGPFGIKIPVRLIIGADGKVQAAHVISGSDAQRDGIGKAVMSWVFKPYLVNGQPVEIETGISFDFLGRENPNTGH